ncbi:hypothetical protein BsWGS_10423 [Bradybaena similaris]
MLVECSSRRFVRYSSKILSLSINTALSLKDQYPVTSSIADIRTEWDFLSAGVNIFCLHFYNTEVFHVFSLCSDIVNVLMWNCYMYGVPVLVILKCQISDAFYNLV